MADLLTHVLVGYVVGTLLAWRYEWFSPALVTAVMAGALMPDLVKIRLVLPSDPVASTLGVPFAWGPLHQVGGLLVVGAIAVVLVPQAMRAATALALSFGASAHVIFDSFLYWPDGLAFEALWPITTYQFATPGFYKSWDMVPLAITLGLVALVLAGHWFRWRRADRPAEVLEDAREPYRADPEWPTGAHIDQRSDGGLDTGD